MRRGQIEISDFLSFSGHSQPEFPVEQSYRLCAQRSREYVVYLASAIARGDVGEATCWAERVAHYGRRSIDLIDGASIRASNRAEWRASAIRTR